MKIEKKDSQLAKEGLVRLLEDILEAGGHYLSTQELKARGKVMCAHNIKSDMRTLGIINAFGDLKEQFKAPEMAEMLVAYRRECSNSYNKEKRKRREEKKVLTPGLKAEEECPEAKAPVAVLASFSSEELVSELRSRGVKVRAEVVVTKEL